MATTEKSGQDKSVTTTSERHSPFAEIDRYFDDLVSNRWPSVFGGHWPSFSLGMRSPFEGRWPKVDVVDRDKEVLIRAELPGVKKEDLDVSVTDSSVTIKATTHHEEKEEKGEYVRQETRHGEYHRTVSLPREVNGDQAKAVFKDGVLELTIPKLEKAKRHSVKVD